MKNPVQKVKDEAKEFEESYTNDGNTRFLFWFAVILIIAFILGKPMSEEETREHNRSATASYSATYESGTITQ